MMLGEEMLRLRLSGINTRLGHIVLDNPQNLCSIIIRPLILEQYNPTRSLYRSTYGYYRYCSLAPAAFFIVLAR
jgi:hypothetical protein